MTPVQAPASQPRAGRRGGRSALFRFLWGARSRRARAGVVVLVIGILFAFPYYWVLVTSVNSPGQVFDFPPHFLPGSDLKNYVQAWQGAPWIRYFLNTVLISSVTVAMALVTSLLAGFALGVMHFRSRQFWFVLVLSMLMIPAMVLLIPDYIILKDLSWLNTYQAQIVPFGASVFGIFLLRQFFLGLPQELIEAAELDGASQLGFLWRIGVPLARPALFTIGLYLFIGAWDSFLWPFIMTSSPSVQPIEVGLATFYGTNGTLWTQLSAAVVFTTLPVMVVFMFAQRMLVNGVISATSGVKG